MKHFASLPQAEFLDPRPEGESHRAPIRSAVNIPIRDLDSRRSELPAKSCPLTVCKGTAGDDEAVAWLRSHGWEAASGEGWAFEKGLVTVCRLWSPNRFLEEWLESAPVAGSALDLGCGGGRDAVFLAAQGWSVLAVDRLEENLHRGAELAERYLDDEARHRVTWLCQDLFSPGWMPYKTFGLVLSFFFFDAHLISAAGDWLAPGGSLLMEAFTAKRRDTHGRPSSPRRVFDKESGPGLFRGLDVTNLAFTNGPNGETARLEARRPR